MNVYTLIAIVLTVSALLGYINERTLRLPTTIAIMAGSVLFSFSLILLGKFGNTGVETKVFSVVKHLNFNELLMQGMLSLLLFAGALSIDLHQLRRYQWEIAVLATFGTVCSTVLIACLSYYTLQLLGVPLPWLYCLLFGALISPTDPIAVLAIFKEVGAPKSLDVMVSGESLFNDGVGIVLFLTLYEVAFSGAQASVQQVSLLFLREAIGGIAYGVLLGFVGYRLLKPIDNYKVEILLTLAMATGGYVLANSLDVSGPLAMVVAGIFIGHKARSHSMSDRTRQNLDNFWELIDEILNAALFLLIGLELLVIAHNRWQVIVGLVTIPLVLIVRGIVSSVSMLLFKRKKQYPPYSIAVLTWGGLRGGLAIALALALPNTPERDIVLTMTYAVVVFSLLVQGMTIKPLIRLTKK